MTTTDRKPSPVPRLPAPRQRRTLRVPAWVLVLAAAVLVLAVVPIAIAAGNDGVNQQTRADDAEARKASVEQAAAPVAATVDQLCRQGDALAADLQARGACAQAVKVKEVISAAPSEPAPTGLSTAQVRGMIEDRVADLPKPVSVEQVTAIVADIFAKNKPADGANATPEMVLGAVTAFCANERCVGPKGEDAPPATDAEILAQVTAYCNANNQCAGPPGPTGAQGAQGVSFQQQYFARDGSGQCFSFVESYDPASNSTTTASSRAGDAACAEPPPSGAPSSLPLPGG